MIAARPVCMIKRGQRAVDLVQQGWTHGDAAAECGIAKSWLSHLVRMARAEGRFDDDRARACKARTLTERAIELVDSGMSITEAANTVGITYSVLARALTGEMRKPEFDRTPVRLPRREARAAAITVKDVARDMRVSITTDQKVRVSHAVAVQEQTRSRHSIEQLRAKGWSVKSIARHLDLDEAFVAQRLGVQWGLPR